MNTATTVNQPIKKNFLGHSLKSISGKTWLLLAIAFLLAISVSLYNDFHAGYQILSGDQYYYKVFNDILSHPHQYALDPIYSNPDNTRIYTPLFLEIIKPAFASLGFFKGLAFCQPFISFLYLLAMFVMLYKVTGKAFVSGFVALVSASKIPAFPIDNWGTLSLYNVMPRSLFLIFVPLLFYAWLRYQNNNRALMLLYFIVGALTHLHPVSGVTLAGPLLFAQFYNTVLKEKNWKQYFLFLISVALPVIPFAMHYFGNSQEGFHLNKEQFQFFFEFMLKRYSFLHPPLGLPSNMDTFLATVCMVAFGTVFFVKYRRIIPNAQAIILFCAGCILVYIAFYAFNFILLVPRQIPPILIDLPRVIKFLLLPTFLAVAIGLSEIQKKSLLCIACLAFFIVFNGVNYDTLLNDFTQHPSQIGRLLRHQVEDYVSTHGGRMTGDQKTTRVFLTANESLAEWLKDHTASDTTLIHTSVKEQKHSSMMLRALSERSVLYAYKDGGLLYYTNKPAFLAWGKTLDYLDNLRDANGYCSLAETAFARERHANYLVCQNKDPVPALPLLYKNDIFSLYRL